MNDTYDKMMEDTRQAFADGWYYGYWYGSKDFFKSRKLAGLKKQYVNGRDKYELEFTLGVIRGENDRRMMTGGETKDESKQPTQTRTNTPTLRSIK